jgi:hypothetical protein
MRPQRKVIVTIAGCHVEGITRIESDNGKSLMILFDEGVPWPWDILEGKQCLLVSKLDDDSYVELRGNRPVQIDSQTPNWFHRIDSIRLHYSNLVRRIARALAGTFSSRDGRSSLPPGDRQL